MLSPLLSFIVLFTGFYCGQTPAKSPIEEAPQIVQKKHVGDYCEGCEGMYENMPSELSWKTSLPSDPGEPLIISGVIYQKDGKTPAPGVILYVYQTNAEGIYKPAEGQKGLSRRHGRLRAWMKTNDKGEYEFSTVRPGSYPGTSNPKHIHPIVKEPDKNEYYIDEYLFDDDPFLTKTQRDSQEKRGGSGVLSLIKNSDGIWVGKRDIVLGLNVTGYE